MQNDELRNANDQLTLARDHYYQLFDLAPVGFITVDRTGKILDANAAARRMLESSGNAATGRPLAAFMNQPSADVLHRHLNAVFACEAAQRCELTIGANDRARVVLLESVLSPSDSDPSDPARATECRSALTDVTDLRRAESLLGASRASSQALMDATADAIMTITPEGRIESANTGVEVVFGYSGSEMAGRYIGTLIPGFDTDNPPSRVDRESTGVHRDGTRIPLDIRQGEWTDHGQPRRTLIIRDLTERKQAEERFRLIAEHTDDVFVVRERATGRLIYVSPAFESLWGRPVEDAYAGSHDQPDWFYWIHPDDRDQVGAAFSSVDGGQPFDEEYRIMRPADEVRWVRSRGFPVFEDDGRIVSDVIITQDVTVERQLADDLRQAQKMELVGSLASGVAHDFNNVLQAVLGCLSLIRPAVSTDRALQFLDGAVNVAQRGGQLARQLTTFSRKQHHAPGPVDVDQLLRGLSHLIERVVGESVHVELHTAAPGLRVLADAVQIEQIVVNLAANARDAMPAGGTLEIRTAELPRADDALPGVAEAGRYLQMTVADTGTGMDERTRSRAFEPFFTTKEIGKGTGLGLATVYGTTRQLGGRVEIDAVPGSGTRFTFVFPCSEQAPRVPTRATGPIRLRGTVLLVEDAPLVRTTVRAYMEDSGLTVLDAADADEAIHLCERRAHPVDVLVTDIGLPGMRGPELASVLRHRHPALLVLFISANPELLEAQTDAAGAVGPDHASTATLGKPFSREALVRQLMRLFNAGSAPAG